MEGLTRAQVVDLSAEHSLSRSSVYEAVRSACGASGDPQRRDGEPCPVRRRRHVPDRRGGRLDVQSSGRVQDCPGPVPSVRPVRGSMAPDVWTDGSRRCARLDGQPSGFKTAQTFSSCASSRSRGSRSTSPVVRLTLKAPLKEKGIWPTIVKIRSPFGVLRTKSPPESSEVADGSDQPYRQRDRPAGRRRPLRAMRTMRTGC